MCNLQADSDFKELVSIVMAVHNGERYISETIDSVLSQTYDNFEFIIVDDGSKDNTVNCIKEYKNDKIKLITQENMGQAAALNRGVCESNGEYIARIDADDICNKFRIEHQIKLLSSRSNFVVVGSYADTIDETGKSMNRIIRPYLSHEKIVSGILKMKGDTLIHSTVMFKKSVFDKVGGYDKRLLASQDIDLWLRMSIHGLFCIIPSSLIKFRMHKDSVSQFSREKQLMYGFIARFKYYFGQEKAITNWSNVVMNAQNSLARFCLIEINDKLIGQKKELIQLVNSKGFRVALYTNFSRFFKYFYLKLQYKSRYRQAIKFMLKMSN